MGLTQKLGTIPLAIQTDSSNNVGIGATPTNFGSSYTVLDVYNGTVGGYLLARSPNVTGQISVDNNTAMYVQSRTNHPIVFAPNNSEKMRLTTAGNLGIGTSNPTAPLDLWKSGGTPGLLASFTDGTYSNFQISTTTTGTIAQTSVSTYLAFGTANVERMRITSGGNVVIGSSTSSGYGNVNLDLNAGTLPAAYFVIKTSSNSVIAEYALDSAAAYLSTKTNHSIRIRTNDIERMRINDGNGEVLMHSTSFNSALDGQLFGSGGDTYFTRTNGNVLWLNRRSSNGQLLIFQVDNSMTGYISTNTYSLPSDINFKKNISDLQLGLNLVNKLRSVSYNHITDDKNSPLSTGFIAQEMEKSLTELGVNKNEYFMLQHNPNNNPKESDYWLDYTKMIPVLVKAIQELSAKVTALENK